MNDGVCPKCRQAYVYCWQVLYDRHAGPHETTWGFFCPHCGMRYDWDMQPAQIQSDHVKIVPYVYKLKDERIK